jgi:uncharacterized protein
MIVTDGLELLTEEQCHRLLCANDFGRVGVSIAALPAIIPVNYRFIDGAVVFRSAPGLKLSAAMSGEVVAFEIDDHHGADRSGWSVLLVGRAEVSNDPALLDAVSSSYLEPFVDGERGRVVRIEPTFVSGRRVVHQSGSPD